MTDITKIIQDPEWGKVEGLIQEYADEQLNIRTLDLTQPAEHVKAELLGRISAYNSMVQFLQDSKIVSNTITRVKNPYR